MNDQKTEASDLRRTASSAAKAAIEAEAEFSARLDACMKEERSQAAIERRDLLSKITDLIDASGEKQDVRLESRINEIRNDIIISSSTLQKADEQYNSSMEVWSQKENLLVDEVLKSRETLKSKMKNDWAVSVFSLYNSIVSFFHPDVSLADARRQRLSMSTIPRFR